MTKAERPKMIFRIPPDLKQRLADRASENRRSLNGELLTIIEAVLKVEPRATPAKPKAQGKAHAHG
jgi:hypothetical protein